jgi:exosome complex component RRP45
MRSYLEYDYPSMVVFLFYQESYGCILFLVDSYTIEKALKKVKCLPTLVPRTTNVTMDDKGDGELENQSEQMPSDVQQISKGGEDQQSLKRNSPLTRDRIDKHKQTSTFIGGRSNW